MEKEKQTKLTVIQNMCHKQSYATEAIVQKFHKEKLLYLPDLVIIISVPNS